MFHTPLYEEVQARKGLSEFRQVGNQRAGDPITHANVPLPDAIAIHPQRVDNIDTQLHIYRLYIAFSLGRGTCFRTNYLYYCRKSTLAGPHCGPTVVGMTGGNHTCLPSSNLLGFSRTRLLELHFRVDPTLNRAPRYMPSNRVDVSISHVQQRDGYTSRLITCRPQMLQTDKPY